MIWCVALFFHVNKYLKLLYFYCIVVAGPFDRKLRRSCRFHPADPHAQSGEATLWTVGYLHFNNTFMNVPGNKTHSSTRSQFSFGTMPSVGRKRQLQPSLVWLHYCRRRPREEKCMRLKDSRSCNQHCVRNRGGCCQCCRLSLYF